MANKLASGLVNDVGRLREKSLPIDMTDEVTKTNVKNALIEMYNKLDGKLQGLAAIQCDLAYRAILLRYKKGIEPVVVYNPRVLFKTLLVDSHEGCLSEGGGRWWIQRPMLARVEYYDYEGIKHREWLTWKKARIFCHECDHLDGILLQDKGKVDTRFAADGTYTKSSFRRK